MDDPTNGCVSYVNISDVLWLDVKCLVYWEFVIFQKTEDSKSRESISSNCWYLVCI